MVFFNFFRGQKKSKDVAKNRLKLVLIHDKGGYAPHILETLKDEILEVIDKYVEVDETSVEVKMIKMKNNKYEDPVSALVANIPIKKIK